MDTFSKWVLFLLAACISSASYADVTVSEKILQKGVFAPPKCNGAIECLCEADIKYPVISGMKNAARQDALNAALEKPAEQVKCQGKPAETTGKNNNFSIRHGYEVTYQSPAMIGFKFNDWAYEGGAHGNGAVEGMIIDLENGVILSVNDIFTMQNIPAVNQVIFDTLFPKSEGIFRDEIEKRKSSFIKDGKCQGCTLVLGKDGLQVIFQAYEVAPFAAGNPAVTIPVKDIAYPALVKTLSAPKSANSP